MLPREKLELYGARSLLLHELISIILYTGTKKLDVFTIAKRISNTIINNTNHTEIEQALDYLEISKTKKAQILALHELINRIKDNRLLFTTPHQIYRFFQFLHNKRKEYFYGLMLDRNLTYINHLLLAKGHEQRILFNKEETIRKIAKYTPPVVVLIHNHPSGNPEPSQDDITTTNLLKRKLKSIGAYLLDHLIIAKIGFFSFRNAKML